MGETETKKEKKKKTKKMIVSDISKCNNSQNTIPPVLLSFSHANCNAQAIANDNDTRIEIELESWNGGQPSLKTTLDTAHISYTSPELKVDPFYTTYIAIREKSTGKTRLIETVRACLRPKVDYPNSTNPLLMNDDSTEPSGSDRFSINKQLIKAFGQRKGQRYYENKDNLQVDEEDTNMRMKQAASGVDATSLESRAADTGEQTSLSIIPDRDENAGRADLIYRIEHLLTGKEIEDLKNACSTILEDYNTEKALDDAQDKRVFSPLGGFFLKKLLHQPELDTRSAALTIYLDSIAKFTKLRPGDLTKGYNTLPKYLSLLIKKKIFDLFSTGSQKKRIVSPELRDKAICYIIILSLMLNDCKVDVNFITESVRVDQKNLKKLVLLTGATVDSDASTGQQKIVLRKTLANFNINAVNRAKKKKY